MRRPRKLPPDAKSQPAPQPAFTPGRVRIGISGWRYKPWRGVFYPPKLPQRRELEFAARTFDTVEINGTFYSLQRPTSFEAWASETPDDFLFSLKGSRFLTHMKKLRGIETGLANFLASGLLALGPKLGPILWQFPPQLHFDPDRFAAFFHLLPRSTIAAAQLARHCDDRMLPRSFLEAKVDQPLRHAVEIRHESFATQPFLDLLRANDIGLVVADTVEWPLLLDVSSSLVYLRLHGSEQLYASGYESEALSTWAHRIVTWAAGGTPSADLAPANPARRMDPAPAPTHSRDVFVYFDNDVKVRAPFDAQNLRVKVDRLLQQKGGQQTGKRKLSDPSP